MESPGDMVHGVCFFNFSQIKNNWPVIVKLLKKLLFMTSENIIVQYTGRGTRGGSVLILS